MDTSTRKLCDIFKLDYNIDLSKQRLEKISFDFANRLTLVKLIDNRTIKLKAEIDTEMLTYLLYNVMGVMNLVELMSRLRLETLPLLLHFDKFENAEFIMLPNHYGIICMDNKMRMGNCINVKIIPFLPSQLAN